MKCIYFKDTNKKTTKSTQHDTSNIAKIICNSLTKILILLITESVSFTLSQSDF